MANIVFPGFPTQGIAFLRDLKKHNDRDWFNQHKSVFENSVRAPMLELIGAIHQSMRRFAPAYVGDPAKAIYRIYRDTRFSKDKTPYKTHVSALFWRNGMKKDEGAAIYFGISHEGIDVAGGVYAPQPDTLRAVREKIAADPAGFRKTFASARARKLLGELSGETLSRVPKGFDPAHPAADLLKHKQFTLWSKLDPALAVTPELQPEILKRIEAMTPFIEYLDASLLAVRAKRIRDEKFSR